MRACGDRQVRNPLPALALLSPRRGYQTTADVVCMARSDCTKSDGEALDSDVIAIAANGQRWSEAAGRWFCRLDRLNRLHPREGRTLQSRFRDSALVLRSSIGLSAPVANQADDDRQRPDDHERPCADAE
jgi:hypothetical protein